MAKYLRGTSSEVYEAAQLFRDRCLRAEGSLIFEGTNLWTSANLDKLNEVFVDSPDTGDRPFLEKFRDQVKPHGQAVIRLAAELLALYFLFPDNVGGFRKREVVNEILAWGGDSLQQDSIVSRAFSTGIGSGGQGYNTRRPFELWFLIEFFRSWKKLPIADRDSLLVDAWKFAEFVDGIAEADSRQSRHMLLHLLFPAEFERIASSAHKTRILAAFRGLIPESPEDVDVRLRAMRTELERLLPKTELDYYLPPLDAAWYDSSEGSAEFSALEVIHHKKQLVLFGPPGTGKTYRASRIADRLIRAAALEKYGPARYFQEQQQLGQAVKAHVHRLQLHPAYSYEDFVRGLHISAAGATEYRLGYLPRLIEEIESEPAATRLPHVLILDELNRTDLSRMLGECFSLLENRDESIDLPGRDSAGQMTLKIPADLFIIGTMNLIDQSIEQVDFALRRRFLWLQCPFDPEALVSAARVKWEEAKTGLEWSRVDGEFQRLAAAATHLNEEIARSPLLGPQYEIGHTYLLDVVGFLKDDLGPKPRGRKSFLWAKDSARRPVEQVWQLSLVPLLSEYLSGLEARARNDELKRLRAAFFSAPEPVT